MAGSDSSLQNYHVALLMSTISSLGWLGVPVLGLYTLYVLGTGGAAGTPALYTVGSLAVGIAFARLERRFQPPDFRNR